MAHAREVLPNKCVTVVVGQMSERRRKDESANRICTFREKEICSCFAVPDIFRGHP